MSLFHRLLRNRPLVYALFALYLALLLRLTVLRDGFWPLHLFRGGVLDLLPLAYYARRARRNPLWLLAREFVGNIVGFAPLGGFVQWRHPAGGLRRALWTGAALSALIETAQIVFGVGRASTGDVVLNALGAVLGAKVMQMLINLTESERN